MAEYKQYESSILWAKMCLHEQSRPCRHHAFARKTKPLMGNNPEYRYRRLTMNNNETGEARKDYSRFKEFLFRDDTPAEVPDLTPSGKTEFDTVREAARELSRVAAEADRLPVTGMLLVEEKVLTRLVEELERLTTE